ncbi:hypothetical protein [Robiginitalea sp. SC105]|uniref:hypothetical protein n=1 Tax=Robiginitalea sp. SC105 TaxID=2762332 RepID=UPI00163A99C1|nr:hypothetical protein [Robiginitalea sp. SC105]MBC2839364.1 hypothetical protein [Robiginitalea sp. SC105]
MLNNKFWQGFFALAPLAGLMLLFAGYAVFIFAILGNIDGLEDQGGPPASFLGGLGLFFLIVVLMVLISLGSLVFYIVHAVKNPNLQHNNLLLVWILLFIFANGIGQLIYWVVEILGKPKADSPGGN